MGVGGVDGNAVGETIKNAGVCVAVGIGDGVDVVAGNTVCVFTSSVKATEIAVSIASAGLVAGVDVKPLQDVNINTNRNNEMTDLTTSFTFP